MIAELHGNCEQKESGHAWLGMVPTHWRVLANRGVFSEVKERGFGDAEMLSVTIGRGILRQSALLSETSKKDSSNLDRSKYKLVRPCDLAYNKMRAWQGAIGVSTYTGIVSPAYVVMRPHINEVVPRYFHYLYRTPSFAKEAERWSYGITSDMWSLRPEHFKTIYTVVPPPDEQALIVRFLDWASVRLGKAIAAKRKVIGLLEEQKQAIIHRAVTRGLDDSAPLKPSGLEWLGDVPQHWCILRAGALFTERKQSGVPGLPMLVVSLNTGVTLAGDVDHRGREKRLIADVAKYSLARSGDIAYNMMRLWQGAVGVVPEDGLVSPAYVVASPRSNLTQSFFYEFVFRTDECKGEFNRQSTGIVPDRNRMYWDSFKQLKLPVPPLNEQVEIVECVKQHFQPILTTVNSLRNEIRLLQEYRTRLIADVVTGKLDVREFARTLPANIAEEAAELASSEQDDDEFTEADGELADELTGEPA